MRVVRDGTTAPFSKRTHTAMTHTLLRVPHSKPTCVVHTAVVCFRSRLCWKAQVCSFTRPLSLFVISHNQTLFCPRLHDQHAFSCFAFAKTLTFQQRFEHTQHMLCMHRAPNTTTNAPRSSDVWFTKHVASTADHGTRKTLPLSTSWLPHPSGAR